MLSHSNIKPVRPAHVIVLGGTGLIGTSITRLLKSQGIRTTTLGRKEIDLEKPQAEQTLAKILTFNSTLITIAGVAPVKNPNDFKRAVLINEVIAKAIKLSPVYQVINISSDSVFGSCTTEITELSCRAPESLYGIAHLARELLLADAAKSAPFANIRPTLLFGDNFFNSGYSANTFLNQMISGGPLNIFGEGEEERDHVWLEDVSRLVLKIVEHRSYGSINAASGYCLSYMDIAEYISKLRVPALPIHSQKRNSGVHSLRRCFNNQETFNSFPDFVYTPPKEAFRIISQRKYG